MALAKIPNAASDAIEKELASRSLAWFVKLSWDVLEPTTPLIWSWHLDAICDHVQALLEGKLGTRNLIINVPPGAMKSRIVSVCAPAWVWIWNPSWRGIFASANPRVSVRDSVFCRDLIRSDWYQRLFKPSWEMTADQDAKTLYRNTLRGFRMATSVGSKITGDRADGLFVDDPLDASEAYSQVARQAVIDWYSQAFGNRLNDLNTGTRCIIMQRLHEADLSGYVLKQSGWDHLCIRQEYEIPESDETTSLNWNDPRREAGELMFPTRFPKEILEDEKVRLGSSGYAGQHQQRPYAIEGQIFKRADWDWYTPISSDPYEIKETLGISRVIQFWDTAFKTDAMNDYTAGITVGEGKNKYYILDLWKQKVEFPELKRAVLAQAHKWEPSAVLVEDKASGQSLIQELKRESRYAIKPIKVDKDKIARAHSITPIHEAGLCALPNVCHWVADFLDSLSSFPNGAHDDDVDAFVGAITYLALSQNNLGVLDFYMDQFKTIKSEIA